MSFEPDAIREVLSRPGHPRGHLVRLRLARDRRSTTGSQVLAEQHWLDDAEVKAYAGDGPLITDDHPRPEYFLLRRLSDGIRRPVTTPKPGSMRRLTFPPRTPEVLLASWFV